MNNVEMRKEIEPSIRELTASELEVVSGGKADFSGVTATVSSTERTWRQVCLTRVPYGFCIN